jgi:N-methylhydantoinase A
MEGVLEAFHAEHERLFGYANRESPISIDTLRVRTIGTQAKPEAVARSTDGPPPEPVERRALRLGGRWIEDVPVYDWGSLRPGFAVEGPAIIQQDLATILVPGGYIARLGDFGDLEMVKD